MDTIKPFLIGSASGVSATCCIQPMDMIKVRIQVAQGSTNPVTVAKGIIQTEGVGGLYRGLSAAGLRQVVYTGTRLGCFDIFQDYFRQKNGGQVSFLETGASSILAGALGALAGNPADLSLIRMQTDSLQPENLRTNYRHVGHALQDILKTDGPRGLFAGAGPTCSRAMALNFGMLTFNSKSKELLTERGYTGKKVVFGSSAIAGFFASFFCLPFDFVKTQMQKQKPDAEGKLQYRSALDCASQQFRAHGITRFWVGFPTFYFRIAPHAMLTLIFQDYIKKSVT